MAFIRDPVHPILSRSGHQLLASLLFLMMALGNCGLAAAPCIAPFDLRDQKSEWVEIEDGRIGHEVYVFPGLHGDAPPVLLLHDLTGLTPRTLQFAQELSQDFTVYVPVLFGSPNQDSRFLGALAFLFNGEWEPQDGLGGSRNITHWLSAVLERIREHQPHQPVGVIGMGLSGSLPLALLRHGDIRAVVVAEPLLPVFGDRDDLGISAIEWAQAKSRVTNGDVKVYGVRFQQDRLAPREKHLRLKRELGEPGFLDREIVGAEYAARDASGESIRIHEDAHSALIEDWCPGTAREHPVNIRRKEVRVFLKSQLAVRN